MEMKEFQDVLCPVQTGPSGTDGSISPPVNSMMLPRHTIVMSLSSSIGTGLWIATAAALHYGGVGSLCLAFLIVGLMLYTLMSNINEMLMLKPHPNGFFGYIHDFGGEVLAETVIINYALLWLFCYPAELVAATKLVQALSGNKIPDAAWITILLIITISTMLLPSKWYGESEFVLGCIKVASLLVCIVLIICIDTGTFTYKPEQALNWSTHRLFGIGGRGPLLAFLSAGFAMGGVELYTLSVLEVADPRKAARSNIKAIIMRLGFCYMLTVILFCTVIYSGDPALQYTTSPIFVALQKAQQPALEKTMIAFVLITLISAANTALYLMKGTIKRAESMNMLPAFLSPFIRAPRCWPAVAAGIAFGCIAFMTTTAVGARAFSYLIGVVAMANYLTWAALTFSHVQFRRALNMFQRDNPVYENARAEMKYVTYGPWWVRDAFVASVILVAFVAQFWLAAVPLDGKFSPVGFLSATGITFIFIVTFVIKAVLYRLRRTVQSDKQTLLLNYFHASSSYK